MKCLSIQSAPLGNPFSQYQSSIQITKTSARTLDMNPFCRYHAKLYLNIHLDPKLYYPFTYTSLSPKQYTAINKHHIPSTLSFMGFNITLSLSYRYGCHPYGGLQLKNPQVGALIKR